MKTDRYEYMKQYRAANYEVMKERKRIWAQKNRDREYDREYSRMAYRKRLPQRTATNIINRLIKLGELKRQPCEVCKVSIAHAHHDDYKRPYDVRWLCKVHHQEWHRENGPGLNRDTLK